MRIKWLLLIVMTLILLLTVPYAGCTLPSEPKPFPPPEGYSSWDEYYRESQQQPASTPIPSPIPTPTPSATPSPKYNWEISDVTYKITEKGENYWYFSWQVTIKNNMSSGMDFFIYVNFVDKDGFIIDYDVESLVLNSKEQKSLKGILMIKAELASDVKRAELGDVSAFTRD